MMIASPSRILFLILAVATIPGTVGSAAASLSGDDDGRRLVECCASDANGLCASDEWCNASPARCSKRRCDGYTWRDAPPPPPPPTPPPTVSAQQRVDGETFVADCVFVFLRWFKFVFLRWFKFHLVCNASPEDPSPQNTHLVPSEGSQIAKIAFGSCYSPPSQTGPDLWQHVRSLFGSNSVWVWLGDNMYRDTNDSQGKREGYNAARNDVYYSTYGPVAEPKIPTTGTWDDHDYGINNYGNNYECRQASQNEFVYHFNIPNTDPRHPAYVGGQQAGVYSSYMFETNTGQDGIHLINLDARYHRSPTFATYGTCEGASSTILGVEQWTWLANELNRPSEIKVIASGIQGKKIYMLFCLSISTVVLSFFISLTHCVL